MDGQDIHDIREVRFERRKFKKDEKSEAFNTVEITITKDNGEQERITLFSKDNEKIELIGSKVLR